jgi:glycosyltransferase involved in cell wall biosynthesis
MRLALLTQYYPPETGPAQNRLSDLARRFVALGHQVEVLTTLPSYPGDEVHPEYLGRENSVEVMDGVRVARVGSYVPREKTFTRRMANYLSFAANAALRGPRLLHRADVLLMESPPLFLALAGIPLARLLRARLWVNVSDLWPRSAVELGLIKPGPALRAAEVLEAAMVRAAAVITGQTEGIVEDIRARFPRATVALLPNGIDVAAFRRPLDRDGLRREFGWGDDLFVIGYAGLMGYAAATDQVIAAAERLRDLPRVHFAFFGHGPCKRQLEEHVAAAGLTNVRFYPHQPSARMPHLQAAFDAGLATLCRASLCEGTRPAKMFEIMAAARPLVLTGRGEVQRIFEATPGGPPGVIAPPEEPAVLAQRVRELVSHPEAAAAMGRRGRDYVFAEFDREVIARRTEALVRATLGL